jgi:hypothetical protein
MRAVDWVVHYWAKTSMLLMTYRPKIVGMEHLPPKGEPVSASWYHCMHCVNCCIIERLHCAKHTCTTIVLASCLRAVLLANCHL